MMSELRPVAQDLIKRVDDFIQAEIAHNESLYHEQSKDENGTWVVPPIMEEMKAKAKAAGLWNLFLPESENGAGLTNFEYAHLAEIMGAYGIASEVFYKAANKLSKHPKSKPIKCASIKGCLSQQIDCCFKKYEQTSKLDKVGGSQHPQPPKTIHLKLKDRSKNDNISVEIGNCKS